MPADSAQTLQTLILTAPLSGPIVLLENVPDPTFAHKLVGDGVAIDPTTEILLAPCQGVVTQLHAAHHALTLTTPEGVEVLMHIGLETVALKGQGFTPRVSEGDQVQLGDPLIAFDANYLAHHAASLLTMVVICNGDRVASYRTGSGQAKAGETQILELKLNAGDDGAQSFSGVKAEALFSEPIVILNPAGLHARPTAVLVGKAKTFASDIRIVKDGREANAKSVVAVMGLEVKAHDKITLKAIGADAQAALAALAPLISSGLGESLHALPPEKAAAPPPPPPKLASKDPNVLLGVSASPGLVTGHVFQLRHESMKLEEFGKGFAAENQSLLAAVAIAQGELKNLAESLRQRADADKAAIFAAHEELLEDPELIEGARRRMRHGKSAAFAWNESFLEQAANLAGLNNELLAGRANDIRDVGRRVLVHLTGTERPAQAIPQNAVLIAAELTPSDAASLDKSSVVGFCTTGGSATSHASILARSMAIPAVAAIEERALELPNGASVVLDGNNGQLRLNPTEAEVADIRLLQERTAATRAVELFEAAKPAVTLDGRRIKVVANIGGVTDAMEVASLGGEGVGLLRSEFLFLQRAAAPSEEEQEGMYASIAKALGPERDLVVRTLDVGGDKPLAYLPLPPEINPFLGVRGIRLNLLGTDLFRSQVRAILKAASFANLHVMFPMVSSVLELRAAKAIVLEEKEALGVTSPVHVGVMVEVPAAAILAEGLAQEADFFSIGTNDLTQYALAIDRGHPRLAAMADALHPAVLKLIERTAQGAHKYGKWVGVCGGLAGEILAVPILLGLGVDELSVSLPSIPSIKAAVRRQNISACRALATEILSMLTAAEARKRLTAFAAENAEKEGANA
ncbi:MAG: phosphoenolpyruvate--protein phosphotransferase [Deltaproteobacteria bacterium]|jgi:phosphocarrier protein FPr|nr:phosphoenolpyruvate--protein phosphotransferase [Deltaproteobacteria bacterium]